MKLGIALRELHRSEEHLARELLRVSDTHRTDHEVHHVARDLAAWSQEHVRAIAAAAGAYGEDLDPEPHPENPVAAAVRRASSDLAGRTSDAGLLLLADLRGLLVHATGVSADWELLAQAAQGARDTGLLGLAERCHPETLRQARWANAVLKESATQVLLS